MTNFTYNNAIPNGPNNPSNDQPLMQANTDAIDNLIKVDHVSFNTNNGGYHTVIHQEPFNNNTWDPVAGTGAPAAIPSVNQVFSLNYLPDTSSAVLDTQFFSMTGTGEVAQLTGFLAPTLVDPSTPTDGYCWIGGILLQWGRVDQSFSSGSTTGTVTFRNRETGLIPFPNNCYSINTTPVFTSPNPAGVACINIRRGTVSNTGFSWQFFTNSSQYEGFFWTAIGN